MSDDLAALRELEKDGLVLLEGGRYRTSRRWKGAVARASLALVKRGQTEGDLRLPIIHALVDIYGAGHPDGDLARLARAMLPIEAAELSPQASGISR